MTRGVGHLMEESLVVGLATAEGFWGRNSYCVLRRGVGSYESGFINWADLGFLNNFSGLLERLHRVLDDRLDRGFDPLRLVKVEGIAPTDEGDPSWASIAPQDHVPAVIPFFEELVVNDGCSLFTLLDVAPEVVGLLVGEPVRGLELASSQDEGIDPSVGFL